MVYAINTGLATTVACMLALVTVSFMRPRARSCEMTDARFYEQSFTLPDTFVSLSCEYISSSSQGATDAIH